MACPTNNFTSGANCEFAEGKCLLKSARTALVDGVPTTKFSAASQCFDNRVPER